MKKIWADFNDVRQDNTVQCLGRWSLQKLFVGDRVLVDDGDDEIDDRLEVMGTVIGVDETRDIVTIQLDRYSDSLL